MNEKCQECPNNEVPIDNKCKIFEGKEDEFYVNGKVFKCPHGVKEPIILNGKCVACPSFSYGNKERNKCIDDSATC